MQPTYLNPTVELDISKYMSRVYGWMTAGVALTGSVAWYISQEQEYMYALLANRFIFFGLMIAQVVLVIWLSARIQKMSGAFAVSMFMLYAALNGVTLSVVSLAYTAESIQSAFFTSSCAFAGLSAFGYVTKKDLGPIGSFCTMGLFGLVGFAILSIFFPAMLGGVGGQIYGLAGILIFAGLTAYDTQKIKESSRFGLNPIMGALKLYLDFINLFLFILRMQGKRR